MTAYNKQSCYLMLNRDDSLNKRVFLIVIIMFFIVIDFYTGLTRL